MRKLPWQDQEVKDYVICCMINIWNVKYNSIHCSTICDEQNQKQSKCLSVRHWISGVRLYSGKLSIRIGHSLHDTDLEKYPDGTKCGK